MRPIVKLVYPGRSYGFRVVQIIRSRHGNVYGLACPECRSHDVNIDAIYPEGGSGPRLNNATCQACGHVGQGTVDRPPSWGVTG